MKVLIIFTAIWSVTLASGHYQQNSAFHDGYKYDGRYGYVHPKIGYTAVPIDTPEVQHARSAHLTALSKAQVTHAEWADDDGSYAGPSDSSNLYDHDSSYDITYDGRYGYAYPKIGHNGVPIDTPEFQHARSAHLSILYKAQAAHAEWAPQINDHSRHRRSVNDGHLNTQLSGHHVNPEAYTYPKFGHDGQPIDTPAVQALKQAHFAAHTVALSLIARQRKNNAWNKGQYDAWKEDNAWETESAWKNDNARNNKAWNNVEHNRKSGFSNKAWDNEVRGNNAWKNVEPATSHSNQRVESGPHKKITWKSNGWSNEGYNTNGWNNEDYNSNSWKIVEPNISHNNEQYDKLSWKADNAWNNEKHDSNKGHSLNAWNNQESTNNARKSVKPATSHSNQHLESGPHIKMIWKNNDWTNEGNNVLNNQNQNLGSYGHDVWNNAPSAVYSHKQSGYQGPTHIPKIDHNGVPEDTPEVQHARKQHLAALAEALERAVAYKEQHQKLHR